MDVVRLNTGTFYPDILIENVDSLIWTERYINPGEFEMRSYDISTIMSLLPVDPISLISLVDSEEVMIVESHDVQVDESGKKILVTKGRSLVSFLDQRNIWGLSNTPYLMVQAYRPYGAIQVILWNSLCNTTINDVIKGTATHDVNEAVPNVGVSDSTKISLSGGNRWVKAGSAYAKILDIQNYNDIGLRVLRPDTASANVVTVGTGTGGTTMGAITKTVTANVTKLLFDTYDGTDHTINQATNPILIFAYDQGVIVDPEYLWTNQNKKTIGYVTSSVGFGPVYTDRGLSYSGFTLRQYLFDAGSDYGGDIDDVIAATVDKISSYVKNTRKLLYFNGTINANSPYKYGVDYMLGDLVTLKAEYGVNVTARVTEYTRTQDNTGAKLDYPTLSWDGT